MSKSWSSQSCPANCQGRQEADPVPRWHHVVGTFSRFGPSEAQFLSRFLLIRVDFLNNNITVDDTQLQVIFLSKR